MGEVVRFRRADPERDAYEAEVHRLCALAGCPDWAAEYVNARIPIEDVLSNCTAIVFGRRLPQDIARRWRRMIGRAGSRRRALPRFFHTHPGA